MFLNDYYPQLNEASLLMLKHCETCRMRKKISMCDILVRMVYEEVEQGCYDGEIHYYVVQYKK